MAWEVESLRATVFAPNTAALRLPTFATIAGSAPLQTVTRAAPVPVTQENGVYGAYQLIVATQPNRADLALGPTPNPTQTGQVTLGEVKPTLAEFVTLLRSWLVPQSDIHRLAVGGTFWQAAKDEDEALKLLLQLVHSFDRRTDPIKHFTLQIARPRQSKSVPNLEITRFVTWQNAAVQVFTIDPTGNPSALGPFHRAQIVLDINTDDKFGALPTASITTLASELVALAEELPSTGDVA